MATRAEERPKISAPATDSMRSLLHKLYLLRFCQAFYSSKYGRHRSMLDTSTFLSNTGRSVSEQFFTFASLAAWLLDTFAGASIGPVQEGDDSAAALRRILHAVEAADVEVPTSWTVTRLQTGSGAEVCGLLNALADLALLRSEFACEQPNHSTGDDDADIELAEVCEEADMTLHGSTQQCISDDVGEEELAALAPSATVAGAAPAEQHPDIIVSAVDREQWDLECQHVMPRLHIRVGAEVRDWRSHLDAASAQVKRAFTDGEDNGRPNAAASQGRADAEAALAWPSTKRHLQHVQTDVAEKLAKIDTREQLLNSRFVGETQQYHSQRQRHATKQEEYEARQADVSQTLGELRKYMDAIDDMQGELDERSSNNFGGIGPTSRARKAIADLKAELAQMDVKVGVARQQLLHMTLKKHVSAS